MSVGWNFAAAGGAPGSPRDSHGKEGSRMENAKGAVHVEGCTPILRVTDIHASVRWYAEVLGFQKEWGAEPPHDKFCSVGLEGGSIMLCQGAQGCRGTYVWIGVDDLDPVIANCRAHGAKVVQPPTNYSWSYEMEVEDPDGHVLRIGCDSREDMPYQDVLDAEKRKERA
jgi:predicted enzyme related to lactoylglutathione lyase